MDNSYNEFNFQFVFKQIDTLKFEIDQLKFQQKVHENYVLELNDFIRNLISFYENKREPFYNNKEKEETKDKQKVKNTIKCRYYNKGFCRSKSSCSFFHPTDLCEQKDCEEKRCPRRHLKQCKNWQKSTCKFGNNCEYKHDPIMKKANETIVLEINEVDSEVEVNDNDSNSSESAMDIINMESSLQNKNETVFSKPNKFTCEKCEYISQTKSNLSKHVKDNHKHTCDECGNKSTSNE